ncbi:hypothetical protein BGZ63DRAFT_373127 [Mariannaea sp. PMI_226]|nr:hypothetical protein BGZ63DRAFT_373127 [Mariannaea sp. PMI_226]
MLSQIIMPIGLTFIYLNNTFATRLFLRFKHFTHPGNIGNAFPVAAIYLCPAIFVF